MASGLHSATIRNYETGRRSPSLSSLAAIADTLRLKVDDLFDGRPMKPARCEAEWTPTDLPGVLPALLRLLFEEPTDGPPEGDGEQRTPMPRTGRCRLASPSGNRQDPKLNGWPDKATIDTEHIRRWWGRSPTPPST